MTNYPALIIFLNKLEKLRITIYNPYQPISPINRKEANEMLRPVAETECQGAVSIKLPQLEEGMVLASDLLMNDGRLLLAKGTTLEAQLIGALQRLSSYRVVQDSIPIWMEHDSKIGDKNGDNKRIDERS